MLGAGPAQVTGMVADAGLPVRPQKGCGAGTRSE
ncbi:hypothetical protein QE377_000712 [Microbacterium sp. SORGH_AS 862]|nr:hypothetical protein [Microbacterium sp. SORGH_AS_0862]